MAIEIVLVAGTLPVRYEKESLGPRLVATYREKTVDNGATVPLV